MKLAVTGKGGVGKTTVSALLARGLQKSGRRVIAIDADPIPTRRIDGYPHPETIKPLVELKDLIEERTGVKPGTTGGMFRLNPSSRTSRKSTPSISTDQGSRGGRREEGRLGLLLPENTMIRSLISHLLTEKNSALSLTWRQGLNILAEEPSRRSITSSSSPSRGGEASRRPSVLCIWPRRSG